MADELREMGVSCLAFRFDHGQKGGTDAESFDQCVLPFGFVQRVFSFARFPSIELSAMCVFIDLLDVITVGSSPFGTIV
jgi:hypothetical protein